MAPQSDRVWVTRRRLLQTGALGLGLGVSGCLRFATGGSTETPTPTTPTPANQDADGDGVIDSEDYAPQDPDIQREDQVKENTRTATHTPTQEPTPTATLTPTPTDTPSPTATPPSTDTPSPTATPPSTDTPSPTATPPPTPTVTPTPSKFVADDGDSKDFFGQSVAVAGDTAVIGAYRDEDPNGEKAGSAYVFERDGSEWEQTSKLTPSDGDSSDFFGWSVAVAGDTAVIGAYRDEDPNGTQAGSAYVFERDGSEWAQAAKLTPNHGDSDDFFGWSVALAGDTAVIGSTKDEDPNGQFSGSAYVFERDGSEWGQAAKLTPSDGDSKDWFGQSVALAGDTAVIGASHDEDPNGEKAGSGYVFERDGSGWEEAAKLTPSDGDSSDRVGESVAVAEDIAVIGAPEDEDPNGEDAGAVYVFPV